MLVATKTILLCNYVSGTGHHESWTVMFANLLIECGYRVVCITPDVDALKVLFASNAIVAGEKLHLLQIPAIIQESATPHPQ